MAQWYFKPVSFTPEQAPSVSRAMRNGLTSSWGSICFGGLILAILGACALLLPQLLPLFLPLDLGP